MDKWRIGFDVKLDTIRALNSRKQYDAATLVINQARGFADGLLWSEMVNSEMYLELNEEINEAWLEE